MLCGWLFGDGGGQVWWWDQVVFDVIVEEGKQMGGVMLDLFEFHISRVNNSLFELGFK